MMAETRVLVVRLGAMGDVIQTLPAVASLKHSFPHSRLSWVIKPRWAPPSPIKSLRIFSYHLIQRERRYAIPDTEF